MTTDKISHLKLPYSFDQTALLHDLNTIAEGSWLPQIYKMNYDGEWTSIALFAPKGENNTFSFSSADNEMDETPILESCPYFKKVIASFECPLISARLLRLNAGARIKPHRDFKLGYENNNFRIHIPIITNELIDFILNGQRLEMKVGECWYTNVNFIHSVENRSSEDRIHLVLDFERNEWSDRLFFAQAPRAQFYLEDDQDADSNLRRTIEELKARNEPHMKEWIEKLERQLTIDN